MLSVRGWEGGKHLTADSQTPALQGRTGSTLLNIISKGPLFHNPLLFNGARPCAFVTINLLEEAFHWQVIPHSLACLNNTILM